MISILLLPLALNADTPRSARPAPPPDTVRVDFPFVKHGPVRLFRLTDGKRDGGIDSVAGLEGEKDHVTDSATYQKLIPLRLEVVGHNDDGTTYRVSYIGYRENPGFKYMWNSSAFRYRYSRRLDYETEPVREENISRTVRMSRDLQVDKALAFGMISPDANLNGNYMYRLNLMPYYQDAWGGRVYLGSSLLSVAFLREGHAMRVSANAVSFGLADVAWFLQTQPGGDWPLNPSGMFGPVAYALHLLHAAPNAQLLVPVYKKTLLLRTGMNTDWFPKGSEGKFAYGVNAEGGVRVRNIALFLGVRDQMTATSPEATGLRCTLNIGFLDFVREPRNYFR